MVAESTAAPSSPPGPTPRVGAAGTPSRGRPRLRSDAEILDAALKAFAAAGFDAMSVRALAASLGLSHGAVGERFGSKAELWRAAVGHGFDGFVVDIAEMTEAADSELSEGDDLGRLRNAVRAFLVAASRRPELGRLMNQEGLQHSERLDHFVETVLLPATADTVALLRSLADRGEIHPVPARMVFFLVAHGAEAPYTLAALSQAFDVIDGPLDQLEHADSVTDLIMRGLVRSSRRDGRER